MSTKEDRFKFYNTNRGFVRCDFEDSYHTKCSVQESSLGTERAIWLGCDDLGWDPMAKQVHAKRMHLNREQVAELIFILKHFVDTGELPIAIDFGQTD